MARRPEISVITLLNKEVVRTDYRKDFSVPIHQVTETVDVEAGISTVLESVLRDQPKPAFRTIFINSQIWSQMVSLPGSSVNGIPEEELEEALKFEAETLSGIEIDQIAIAYSPISNQDEFHTFWVSAISKEDLDQIHSVFVSYGCRDLGVAHPCGLGASDAADGKKSRVEIWENLAYQIQAQTGKLLNVRQVDLGHIPQGAVVLDGSSVDLQWDELDLQLDVRNLGETKVFDRWVSSIAESYSGKAEHKNVPLIRFTKGNAGTPVRHLVSAAIAIVTLGFCLWHYFYLKNEIVALGSEIEKVKAPAEEKNIYDNQLKKILLERQAKEEEEKKISEDLGQLRFFLNNQRDRIKKLLELLVDLRTDDLVVKKIGSSEDGISISGFMVDGESAQTLASGLREKADTLGWLVNPATLTGQEKLTTGGPWDFEILLSDSGPFGKTKPGRRIVGKNKKKSE